MSKGKKREWLPRLKSRGARLWAFFLVVAALLAFYLDFGDIRRRIQSRRIPEIEIQFYRNVGNELQLATGPTAFVDEKSIREKAIEVPLYLAFRNAEKEPVDIERVELDYPHDLQVYSQGRAKIDPSGGHLIYEHNLGIVEPSASFTPVTEIDKLFLPTKFLVDEAVVLTKDEVPIYIDMLIGVSDPFHGKREIPFELTVYCHDRPPLHRKGLLTVEPAVSLDMDLPHGKFEEASAHDLMLVRQLRTRPDQVLQDWTRFCKKLERTIHYERVTYKHGTFDLVFVDNNLRRVIADSAGNGFQSYELLMARDSLPKKLLPDTAVRMKEWMRQAAK